MEKEKIGKEELDEETRVETEKEKIERELKEAAFRKKVEEAQAAVLKAKSKKEEAENAYKLAFGGNLTSHILTYVGLFVIAASILTGGLALAPFGAAMFIGADIANKNYYKTEDAQKKATALKEAENEYKQAVAYANSLSN